MTASFGLRGEDPDVEAEHGVEAELSGNDHGHGHWCFTEGIREPAMEREYGYLDREGEQKCESHPEERSGGNDPGGDRYTQFAEIKCAGTGVKVKDGHEQGSGWNEGEEEELCRRLLSFLAAVHRDQDRHGDQRQFPEAVVEHQVQRDEDAVHRRLLQKEERVKGLFATSDRFPACQHAHGAEQTDEDDKPHAEAVYTNVIVDCRVLDPSLIYDELKSGLVHVEVCGQMQSQSEGDESCEQRNPRGQLSAIG
jgi:hypothetical protein